MRLVLSAYPKTVPSNYKIIPEDVSLELTPGETLDDEAWAKHERQCSPYYEWWDYQKKIEDSVTMVDHPELAKRMKEQAMIVYWNDLLSDLEPFNEYA